MWQGNKGSLEGFSSQRAEGGALVVEAAGLQVNDRVVARLGEKKKNKFTVFSLLLHKNVTKSRERVTLSCFAQKVIT